MINTFELSKSPENKVATNTEQMWFWLDGDHYDGILSTPQRFYTELTAALFANSPKDFIRLARVTDRRFQEIAVLNQELADIRSMLAQSMAEYEKAQTA